MSSSNLRSPAGSPPAPANAALPNPRKRPSVGGPPAGTKRRKPSNYSATSSSHPLRQTSFPPEEAISNGLRSPSVETDIVAPSVTASLTGGKRGKKGKSAAPEGSVKSGKAGANAQRGDTPSKADGEEGEEEEDDEDDDGEMVESNKQQEDADAAEAKRRYAMLFQAADADQQDRLGAMRRFRLNDGKLRRIVNQILSQSVPKSVILAVNSYTKQFVGEIIEKALDIQRMNHMAAKGYLTPDIDGPASKDDPEEKEDYIGPLLPDSLREALRRMKRDGELGGAGMEGFSTGIGIPGARTAALGGRRLFR